VGLPRTPLLSSAASMSRKPVADTDRDLAMACRLHIWATRASTLQGVAPESVMDATAGATFFSKMHRENYLIFLWRQSSHLEDEVSLDGRHVED
jgi:hypothetical protein